MMKCLPTAAVFLVLTIAAPTMAQTVASAGGAPLVIAQATPTPEEPAKPRRSRKRDGASKKEMSVNQMAASERRKKCGAEWKEAKAAGNTGGLKWPKFYSQCNTRLKGKSA